MEFILGNRLVSVGVESLDFSDYGLSTNIIIILKIFIVAWSRNAKSHHATGRIIIIMKKITKDYLNYFTENTVIGVAVMQKTTSRLYPNLCIRQCVVRNNELCDHRILYCDRWKVSLSDIRHALRSCQCILIDSPKIVDFLDEHFSLPEYPYIVIAELAKASLNEEIRENLPGLCVMDLYEFFYYNENPHCDLGEIAREGTLVASLLFRCLQLRSNYPIKADNAFDAEELQNCLQDLSSVRAVNLFLQNKPLNKRTLFTVRDFDSQDYKYIIFNATDSDKIQAFFKQFEGVSTIITFGEETIKTLHLFFAKHGKRFNFQVIDLQKIAGEIFGKKFTENDYSLSLRFMSAEDYPPDDEYRALDLDYVKLLQHMLDAYAFETKSCT